MYGKRTVISLIMVALVDGLVGCGDGGGSHSLTIASTEGGSVIAPGEGTFTYNTGTVERLWARSALGYGFAEWAGDVATVNTVNSFSTTITMYGDYIITANFGCGC